MIIFWNDDRAYLSWLAHHRVGFVLESDRKPHSGHVALHRAVCESIKHSATKATHWTTGRRMKVCSLDAEELRQWAVEYGGGNATNCAKCQPERESPGGEEHDAEPHLTKLDRGILSFVLEIATSHLEEDDAPYVLSVGSISRCFGKSPAQLTAALTRLVGDGLLTIPGPLKPGAPLLSHRRVFPTVEALRTLTAFAQADSATLNATLARLSGES